jgi:hypothetical protein
VRLGDASGRRHHGRERKERGNDDFEREELATDLHR